MKSLPKYIDIVFCLVVLPVMVIMFPIERWYDHFQRVHRSFIVPLEEIDFFSNRKISIRNVSKIIPVGRTYNETFQNLYTVFKSKNK